MFYGFIGSCERDESSRLRLFWGLFVFWGYFLVGVVRVPLQFKPGAASDHPLRHALLLYQRTCLRSQSNPILQLADTLSFSSSWVGSPVHRTSTSTSMMKLPAAGFPRQGFIRQRMTPSTRHVRCTAGGARSTMPSWKCRWPPRRSSPASPQLAPVRSVGRHSRLQPARIAP